MSSDKNILVNPSACKSFSQPKCCVFCSFDRIWRHGTYSRTATYSKTFKNPPEEQQVQRYHCQNPPCKRTFSQLPPGILPYCRFWFQDICQINQLDNSGLTAYAIRKQCQLQLVSLAAIKRLLVFVKRTTNFLQNWCREITLPVSPDLIRLSSQLLSSHTWFTFSIRLYHALYPKRLWVN